MNQTMNTTIAKPHSFEELFSEVSHEINSMRKQLKKQAELLNGSELTTDDM